MSKFSKKDSENKFSDTSKMHLLWRSIFGVLKNFYKKILDTFKIKDFEVFDEFPSENGVNQSPL